mgnify:CR=1 FL=1
MKPVKDVEQKHVFGKENKAKEEMQGVYLLAQSIQPMCVENESNHLQALNNANYKKKSKS